MLRANLLTYIASIIIALYLKQKLAQKSLRLFTRDIPNQVSEKTHELDETYHHCVIHYTGATERRKCLAAPPSSNTKGHAHRNALFWLGEK
jgi:hypothetical protein